MLCLSSRGTLCDEESHFQVRLLMGGGDEAFDRRVKTVWLTTILSYAQSVRRHEQRAAGREEPTAPEVRAGPFVSSANKRRDHLDAARVNIGFDGSADFLIHDDDEVERIQSPLSHPLA